MGVPFYDSFTAKNFSAFIGGVIKSFTLLHILITCGVHDNTKMYVLFTLLHIVLYCLLKLSFLLKKGRAFPVCEAFRMISQQLVWGFFVYFFGGGEP